MGAAGSRDASGAGGGGTSGGDADSGADAAGTTGAAGDAGAAGAGTTGADGGDGAADTTGADGSGADSGLAPGTCLASRMSSSPMCTDNGLPKYEYVCLRGGPPPADSCVHPPSSVDNNAFKYCCAEAVCTHQGFNDLSFCQGKPGTPHAVLCQNDAITPAGCITINSEVVNRCCP
jgi:hypothetical protein